MKISYRSKTQSDLNVRWEDDGLSDHLAVAGKWDTNGVTTGTWSTTDEWSIGLGCPTTMADISLGDLRVNSVVGGTSKHTEPLGKINACKS
jgi:hypothetical protein